MIYKTPLFLIVFIFSLSPLFSGKAEGVDLKLPLTLYDHNPDDIPKGTSEQNKRMEDDMKRRSNLYLKTVKASQSLQRKYKIQACSPEAKKVTSEENNNGDEDGKDKNEDEESSQACSSGDQISVLLQDKCMKLKNKATQCCENPNACDHWGKEVAKVGVALAPTVYGAVSAINVNKDVGKGKIAPEEIQSKLCGASNNVQLGAFASGLLLSLAPAMEATCKSKMDKCTKGCNNAIGQFEQDLKKVYGPIFKSDDINDINKMVRISKKCLYGDENAKFENIDIPARELQTIPHFWVKFTEKDSPGATSQKAPKGWTYIEVEEDNSSSDCSVVDGKIAKNGGRFHREYGPLLYDFLFLAKAYHNMMRLKDGRNEENLVFNEKNIANCRHQPNRVVAEAKRIKNLPAGPALQICQGAVKAALNTPQSSTGATSSASPRFNSANSISGGSGRSTSNSNSPLLGGGGDDDATLPDEEDFEDDGSSALASNTPGWKSLSGGSGSGGGGGGFGGGGFSSGGGGGPPYNGNPNDGSSFDYGDSAGSGGFSGGEGFGGGGYSDSEGGYPGTYASAGNSGGSGDRRLADHSDMGGMPMGEMMDSENLEEGGSIFDVASRRIQTFCSDYVCDTRAE